MHILLAIAFQLLCVGVIFTKHIPSFIPVCEKNDPEFTKCFLNAFYEIRPYLSKGIPEMDLPPGEPLRYLNVTFNTGRGTSVSLEALAWNQIATGLMNVEIKEIAIDFENARCTAVLLFPHVRLQGDYKFKGKILLFEIDSTGQFDINSTAVTANVQLNGNYYTKNEKQFIEFENVGVEFYFKRCRVHFGNLIKGNEAISKALNQAINDNIQSIKEELHPILAQAIGGVTQQYFNKFFKTFSIEQLFPEN